MGAQSDMSYCGRCKQQKPKSEFHRDATRGTGVTGHCKVCKKKWRENNAKYLVDKAIEWQRNNPEKAKEHGKKWRDDHPDKVRAKSAVQNKRTIQKRNGDAALLEKRREQNRRSAQKRRQMGKITPEADKVKRNKRRAMKQNNGGTFTENEWLSLCTKYGNICLCCGETKRLTIDHVVPLSRGGDNTIDNAQPLCHQCNSRKGTSSTDYRLLYRAEHGNVSFQLNLI